MQRTRTFRTDSEDQARELREPIEEVIGIENHDRSDQERNYVVDQPFGAIGYEHQLSVDLGPHRIVVRQNAGVAQRLESAPHFPAVPPSELAAEMDNLSGLGVFAPDTYPVDHLPR